MGSTTDVSSEATSNAPPDTTLDAITGSTSSPAGSTGSTDTSTTTQTSSEAVTDSTTDEPSCGDGIVGPGEQCDDANREDLDACSNACITAACGDGKVSLDEACDDGNTAPGDTCSPACNPTQVLELSMGAEHVCLVFANKKVRCWGRGDNGGLGYGDMSNLGDQPGELPTPDIDIGSEVVQMSGGWYHRCARLAAGNVRCWGLNHMGQLGYESTEWLGDNPTEMPTADVSLGGDALQVAAGAYHTCAIIDGGIVKCWGAGAFGILGSGATENVGDKPGSMPPKAVPGIEGATQIALSENHTCALQNGEVRCWGRNSTGALGLGHTNDIGDEPGEMPPASVLLDKMGGIATQISAGSAHTCALMDSGKVRCWGGGKFGRLGYGNVNNIGDQPGEMPPADVPLGAEKAIAVSAGHTHTCALLESGKVMCWGRGEFGELGHASTANIGDQPGEMPPPDIDLGGEVAQVSAHLANATCALLKNGTLRCWGINAFGQLGLGHTEDIGDDELAITADLVPF